ncbi:MAG: hypothetical protein CM15mP44_1820 [Candidatus Neomarinimicrobiota bacterium]|nr:MAG: hypothetical protein CM15mP44_1820 [Candidatus Neomarinimicrobiota bacterium]
MDSTGNAGSVAFLQNIKHPVSVARKVMDDTETCNVSWRRSSPICSIEWF